jgi:hypothetical protein
LQDAVVKNPDATALAPYAVISNSGSGLLKRLFMVLVLSVPVSCARQGKTTANEIAA